MYIKFIDSKNILFYLDLVILNMNIEFVFEDGVDKIWDVILVIRWIVIFLLLDDRDCRFWESLGGKGIYLLLLLLSIGIKCFKVNLLIFLVYLKDNVL